MVYMYLSCPEAAACLYLRLPANDLQHVARERTWLVVPHNLHYNWPWRLSSSTVLTSDVAGGIVSVGISDQEDDEATRNARQTDLPTVGTWSRRSGKVQATLT
jgi:hypothetical protein